MERTVANRNYSIREGNAFKLGVFGANCSDCGIAAPELNEQQTLRSGLGWRLSLERQPDGTTTPIWRCPHCWQKKKQQRP